MFFLLNTNRCFECAMEKWERLFGALVPKHPAHRTAVSLPHSGHTKADGLRPEGSEPGEMSKAECRSPNRRIEAHIGILSKASFLGLVCLSAVYSIDTEWRYPIFMDTFYVRQPGTSLPPHSPDPPQHTAFPWPRHLGGCEDTQKKCTLLQGCRRYHTCGTPWRSRQSWGSWSLPLSSTLQPHFPQKANTELSPSTGRAVHFSQIPSRQNQHDTIQNALSPLFQLCRTGEDKEKSILKQFNI